MTFKRCSSPSASESSFTIITDSGSEDTILTVQTVVGDDGSAGAAQTDEASCTGNSLTTRQQLLADACRDMIDAIDRTKPHDLLKTLFRNVLNSLPGPVQDAATIISNPKEVIMPAWDYLVETHRERDFRGEEVIEEGLPGPKSQAIMRNLQLNWGITDYETRLLHLAAGFQAHSGFWLQLEQIFSNAEARCKAAQESRSDECKMLTDQVRFLKDAYADYCSQVKMLVSTGNNPTSFDKIDSRLRRGYHRSICTLDNELKTAIEHGARKK